MSKDKETKPVGDVILKLVKQVLGKMSLVHQCSIKKKKVKLAIGARFKKLLTVIIGIKVKNHISIVTLNLAGYKYHLYIATGKVLSAIKASLLYVKAKLFGDKAEMKRLRKITLTKKEYKKIKSRKDEMLGGFRSAIKTKKKKRKGSIGLIGKKKGKGPLEIQLGYRGGEDKAYKKAKKFSFA